ncbi:hypothetical protein MLD38_009696 [Melastoma candidum]|uniref:Uncharacterized protein n=1 Tax=Melastoma candidum TaxID=119954 RepID=A0ACB9RYE6_9MYRT|nr:hypothetical protein MLD38_009696 [Melastoma candidum]
MEAARIDWKNIESVFVEDRLYEHFHAPKWVDLSSSSPSVPGEDVAWFCKPDCNHPKTADDFLLSTPSPFKRMAPRGCYEDGSNKSPVAAVPAPLSPVGSNIIPDLSAERRKLAVDDSLRPDAIPRLKSTLSASNLFAGRDLLKQISEFCSELTKLAIRTKEKESPGTRNRANGIPPAAKAKSSDIIPPSEVGAEYRERSPLLKLADQTPDVLRKGKAKDKKRPNRAEDAENVPISIELDKVGHKGHLSQIRTSPPTPQCISATRGPQPESTASPASKTSLKERHILEEVKVGRREAMTEENIHKGGRGGGMGVVDAKTPDVFWFLKPCTLPS